MYKIQLNFMKMLKQLFDRNPNVLVYELDTNRTQKGNLGLTML